MVYNRDKVEMIKKYAPNAEPVYAILLTADNLQEAAIWCAGAASNPSRPQSLDSAFDVVLRVPTLDGPVEGSIGTYLVKDNAGKFSFWPASVFEEKYHEVGLRQNGPNLMGTIRTGAGGIQPKGWGANSDSP